MKISTKTLNAARKAAKARGMSLEDWAEQVLARAAAAPQQPPDIEAHLREISRKIDLIADRQNLGERASEQLAGAVQEMGASYKRARDSAGQVLSEAGTKTSSAAEEMAARARELIGRARKMTTELVGSLTTHAEREDETADEPGRPRPSRARSQSRAADGAGNPATTARKRPAAKRKAKVEKPRASNTRRSPAGGTSRQR